MKTKVLFIERKFWEFVSIEKVFRQIAKHLNPEKYDISFQQLSFGNRLSGVLKNLIFFRRRNADIFHITGHIHYISLVLPKKRTILTVHDLGFLHTRSGLRRYILKKIYLDFPIKKLNYITAISEATKDEIIRRTGCNKEKIRVIENPLQDNFYFGKKKDFNEQCPRILQIGTQPHKNLNNLIKALKGLNCHLVIIGRLNEETIRDLEDNKIRFENRFGLNDSEIRKEYEEADIVSFCSLYEGFGLIIIEAQAMRTPVITSNISPLKEVSGGAAHLSDPFDALSIRQGIDKLIQNAGYRNKLIDLGLENIKRFKSETIVKEYEKLYTEVLEKL
ncbi:MAG: glycosyltransferase, group 1 family [Acidobacteria bacterium]|jgi:glycosyltransferase involved in cell wall biosynthesis|nr:glycosyltransferase, group 1 family [Acidobacteriota bacterium]